MQNEHLLRGLEIGRFRTFGRAVNGLCLLVLLFVMGMVIYGFLLRAPWERGYYVASAVAIASAFVVLVALAQQEIAARDKATWRDMAEWQIRATYRKLVEERGPATAAAEDKAPADRETYYRHLIEALIDDMQRISSEPARP